MVRNSELLKVHQIQYDTNVGKETELDHYFILLERRYIDRNQTVSDCSKLGDYNLI